MWISWLFKINYFNNMSPHYKHIYLCHPPFKHLSPVSDMYEAKLEAGRPHFLVPPPSAHQWRSDRSPFSSLSPSPYFSWWCWAWSHTPPPRPCSATPPPSSLPLFADNNYLNLKQEISKFLTWNLIRSSKLWQSCYQWSAMMFGWSTARHTPPADPLIDWPSLWPSYLSNAVCKTL